MIKDVFTPPEVGKICRVSRHTVNRWINEGKLKAFRPTENAVWKVTRKNLIKFMESNGIPMEFLRGDKIKVLIVDDEEIMTAAIERGLVDEERFQIEIANSGFIAGAKLENFKPDIVVLDILLGDMDGRELFKYIQNSPDLNGIKVIGISGKLRDDEIQPLLDQGFNSFLHKPFNTDELKALILKEKEV